MGTETMLQAAAGGLTSGQQHHHQQVQQQRQHNHANAHPQPYVIDGGTAFTDSEKVTGEATLPLHPDVYTSNHHIHSPPGAGGKFPPAVGIYRPPAARRALQLAENAFHQLAPPAACEHPSDYAHLTLPSVTTTAAGHHQQHSVPLPAAATDKTTDKALGIPVAATPPVWSSPDSTEGALPFGKDERETGEKTGLPLGNSHCNSTTGSGSKCAVQTSQTVPDDADDRVLGSDISDGSPNSHPASSTGARANRPHRERRPDRAVYVPRARRSLTTPPVTTYALVPAAAGCLRETVSKASSIAPTVAASRTDTLVVETAATTDTSSPCPIVSSEGAAASRGENRWKLKLLITAPATPVQPTTAKGQLQNNKSILNCDTVIEGYSKGRTTHGEDQRDPVELFKKRSYSLEEQDHPGSNNARKDQLKILTEASCGLDFFKQHQQSCDFSQPIAPADAEHYLQDGERVGLAPKSIDTSDTMQRNNNRTRNAKNVATVPMTGAGMLITDRPTEGDKIDRDEKELRRASQEMNRSNRRIMKQTFNSDVLEIDDPLTPAPPQQCLPKKHDKKTVVQNGDSTGYKPPGIVGSPNGGMLNGKVSDGNEADEEGEEEEEEDWESMYDDNGDCLNTKMLAELTTAVGKVAIEMPHSDYKAYETKQAVLNEEEFPHVLEVSSFPAEFKTQDLMMLFSQYKESGFDIKWVDDTHALAVFSSSKIAAEVLATGNSFAQVKPLAEATPESRSKARKCASSLQPYRARPETCAALARRLVTTALGVRLKTAPEERENERRVLREAKERKLLAAKQRDELWES